MYRTRSRHTPYWRLASLTILLDMNTIKHLFLFGLGVMLVSGLSACKSGSEKKNENVETLASAAVPVETVVLGSGNFENMIQIPGVVESVNDVTVSAMSAGVLKYVAPVGKFVGAGETVAQVDPALAEASVTQAKAAVESVSAMVENAMAQMRLAEDAFRRQEPLYRDSIISAIEFEGVKTRLAAAKAGYNQALAQKSQTEAALTLAYKQLSNTRVTAPFSGKIERRLAEPGATASPGLPIVQIVNAGNVKVTGGISERYAATVKMGTPVVVKFPSLGTFETVGSISFVGSVINSASRTFPIEIQVANGGGELKPQMTVEIYVNNETMGNVIVVPETAVIRDEEGTSVFIAKTNGKQKVATRVKVNLGPVQQGKTVVLGGLNVGDELIVNGQNNVSEGDAVDVVKN